MRDGRVVQKILIPGYEVEQQQAFRQRHLARVAELQTDDGLWLDVEVRISVGTVPTNAG